jgi:hypothetical protein
MTLGDWCPMFQDCHGISKHQASIIQWCGGTLLKKEDLFIIWLAILLFLTAIVNFTTPSSQACKRSLCWMSGCY